jgi:hypothetical protein
MSILFKQAWLLAVCALATMCLWAGAEPPGDESIVPKDYRKWTHVKSAVVGPKSKIFESEGGVHHIYANDKAMEGLKSGNYPEGATLVYDLLELKETDGNAVEGNRRRIDLMVKNAERGKDTDGWYFQRVMGDKWQEDVLTANERTNCFKCHARQKAKDYVFSTFRK